MQKRLSFLIVTAVLLFAMFAMAQSFQWPMFLPAITGQKWDVVCDVAGSWTRYNDWGCDGISVQSDEDQFNDNHTWTSSRGYQGTWSLTGAHISLKEYPVGIIPFLDSYKGTLNATCDYMSGEMSNIAETGCWYAYPNGNGQGTSRADMLKENITDEMSDNGDEQVK